jgi:hypothetical protein
MYDWLFFGGLLINPLVPHHISGIPIVLGRSRTKREKTS